MIHERTAYPLGRFNAKNYTTSGIDFPRNLTRISAFQQCAIFGLRIPRVAFRVSTTNCDSCTMRL